VVGWHGNKALGFLLNCYDVEWRVTMSAPHAITMLAAELLKGKVCVSPKHAMCADFEKVDLGELPAEGHPDRSAYLTMQTETRHGLSALIYYSHVYPQIQLGNVLLCRTNHSPSHETRKCLEYMLMHLISHDEGISYGGQPYVFLDQPDPLLAPFAGAARPMYYHHFTDASLTNVMSGGVGFLSCGPLLTLSQTQHIVAPCAHSNEVVAGGSNHSLLVPVVGLLQEVHVQCGAVPPLYFDSKTTIFVSMDDAADKKSIWVRRRTIVLQEGTLMKDFVPLHIDEFNNVADMFTKFLPYDVWNRLVHYLLNRAGDTPALPPRKQKIADQRSS